MNKLLRLSLIIVFFCLSLFVYAYPADILRPTGYEAIAVDDSAGGKALTAAKYYNTTTARIVSDYAIVVLEAAPCRFTVDGTTVTDTAGVPLQVNQGWVLETFDELQNFRIIRTGAVSGSLKVIYYKRYRQ